MIFELLSLRDLDDEFSAAWTTLSTVAAEHNPFFDAELLVPALTHLDPRDEVRLFVGYDGRELVFLLPVVPRRRFKGLPLRTLLGWRHPHCFLGTPLAHPDALPRVARALTERRVARSLGVRLIVLSWADAEGPVVGALSAARGRSEPWALERFERPLLRRRSDGQGEGLGSETQRRLARRGRALEREHGPVAVVDVSADPDAPRRFLELEASGWKAREGTALASKPEEEAFFLDAVGRLAIQNRLEMRSFETPDRITLAMSVRFAAREGVFCFKVAYDERFKKYAPGFQLELANLAEFAASERHEWVDACTAPGNEFFEAVFPDRRSVANVLVPVGGASSATMVAVLPRLRTVRDLLRRAR